MRSKFFSIFAVLFALTFATPSHAVSGWQEKLVFVTDIAGQDRSLCHLVKAHHAMFVLGLGVESQGYAIADNQCNSDQYTPITPVQFQALQSLGAIPSDIPATPGFTDLELVKYNLGIGIFALFLVGGIIVAGKRALSGGGSGSGFNQIARRILCRAACSDGAMTKEKAEHISFALKRLTGKTVSVKSILAEGTRIQPSAEAEDFTKAAKKLNPQKKTTLMRGVLFVLGVDATPQRTQMAFADRLARAMSLNTAVVSNMARELQR